MPDGKCQGTRGRRERNARNPSEEHKGWGIRGIGIGNNNNNINNNINNNYSDDDNDNNDDDDDDDDDDDNDDDDGGPRGTQKSE